MKSLILVIAAPVLLAGCGAPAPAAPAGATVVVPSTPVPNVTLAPTAAPAIAAPATPALVTPPTIAPTLTPPPVVAPTPAPAAESGVVAVDIIGFVYEPSPVVVRVGTTVVWTNVSEKRFVRAPALLVVMTCKSIEDGAWLAQTRTPRCRIAPTADVKRPAGPSAHMHSRRCQAGAGCRLQSPGCRGATHGSAWRRHCCEEVQCRD